MLHQNAESSKFLTPETILRRDCETAIVRLLSLLHLNLSNSNPSKIALLAAESEHKQRAQFSNTDYRLAIGGRVVLVVLCLFLVSGFRFAYSLEPDPRGFGTHEQLGLPACSFRAWAGVLCPTCGMTTSFSNFVRGRFLQAARANFAGLALATICVALIPWSIVSIWQGRTWKVSAPDVMVLWLALGMTALSLTNWLCFLLFG